MTVGDEGKIIPQKKTVKTKNMKLLPKNKTMAHLYKLLSKYMRKKSMVGSPG